MQSWPNSGAQNGADGQPVWQPGYAFGGQDEQFEAHPEWSQPLGDQVAYQPLNPQDGASPTFFDPPLQHQQPGNSFLAGNIHGAPPNQPGYHSGQEQLSLGHQYSQSTPDVIDPTFTSVHPDLYNQQGKLGVSDGINHMSQVQEHPHAHTQAYPQQGYSFGAQTDQPPFDSSAPHFSPSQLLPQPSRQQSHTPIRQFDSLQTNPSQNHSFSRPPQHSPVQSQPAYVQGQPFSSHENGHQSQYQPDTPLNYQQPQQIYTHAEFPAQEQPAYGQPRHDTAGQQFAQTVQQPADFAASQPPKPMYNSLASPISSTTTEQSTKKRKRTVKSPVQATVTEPVVFQVDSPVESLGRRTEDIDSLLVPVPSPEEAQLMARSSKRNKAAQAKQPTIKGMPHLLYDGSVKLPAPKSHDKLTPLVALPPRSGKQMIPQLGFSLPCEVQGRFTSQYRPTVDKGGLDERRAEAKLLLDDYDRSMKMLGKRRPKYTEYPHAFKEQLKADEASKNKAGKKAKKEQEGVQKPVRPATRPADPTEGVVWDIIGIVHIEESVARTNALIAGRVQQAGDFFIKLRGEMNRAKQELDQGVTDKAPEAEMEKYKQESEQKKEALYRALDAVVEHADDAVLDNLGGHQKLVSSMVNVLISCIKASDFSGKLPKIVLELFTHFPMTKKIAETTNFDTVRKRLADKGDNEVKELVREISVKVKKFMKTVEPETSTGYTGTSAASRAKTVAKPGAAAPEGSSIKRSRDDDSADARTVKRIQVEPGSGSLSKKLAQPKTPSHLASKTATTKPAAAPTLPGKSRPLVSSVPKPEGIRVDSPTLSAEENAKMDAKKIISKAESTKPVIPKAEPKPPAPRMAAAPTSSALSGIASLLDSINAPKAELPAQPAKETKGSETPETPEQRAKRIRKEGRRKLRVSWKPDEELEHIRIFEKEESEDGDRDVSMTRDAADDRSEGMVLKRRANEENDDEEDDIPYQPWEDPVAVDFSALPDTVRDKNYVTRGGKVTFTTDEQRHMADREKRELMAIYTSPDEIPTTPRSPPHEPASATNETKVGQLSNEDPKFGEIQLRWRDEQQLGVDGALYAATQRLDAKQNPANKLDSILGRLRGAPSAAQPSHITSSAASGYNSVPLAVGAVAGVQVYAWLCSDKVQNWYDPEPARGDALQAQHYADPKVETAASAVEIVARALSSKAYPATSPPEWILADEERVREWWFGYNKEMAAKDKKAGEERARALAEANALRMATATHAQPNGQEWASYQAQQQAYAPYMALLQQMTGGQAGVAPPAAAAGQIPDGQLQSILAAINQSSQQPAQGQESTQPNPNDASYQHQLRMLTQQMTQGPHDQPPPPPPPPAADRDWDRNEDQGRGDPYKDGKDGRAKKKGTLPPHKPANKALIGTKSCTFWQQGKCARGDLCTFRHD